MNNDDIYLKNIYSYYIKISEKINKKKTFWKSGEKKPQEKRENPIHNFS